VETAAFGCPAATAAVFLHRKFSAPITDIIEQRRNCFHGGRAGKSNRPLGDGQPKAAVPTRASDRIQGLAKFFPVVCPSSFPARSRAFR
jgi:hypothetical protein